MARRFGAGLPSNGREVKGRPAGPGEVSFRCGGVNVPFGDTKSLAFRRREETCILVACGDIATESTQKQI